MVIENFYDVVIVGLDIESDISIIYVFILLLVVCFFYIVFMIFEKGEFIEFRWG